MHIFAVLSGCPVVMSDRTHTGIRYTLSLHTEHVYKDNFWVEMSVKMNYSAIFQCSPNTGHHGAHAFILRFHMNQMFLKHLSCMFNGGLSEI